MKSSKARAYQLATAVAIGGVAFLGTAPAYADGLSYYNGSGSGTAVSVTVSPNAVLNVNLDAVKGLVSQLPLGADKVVGNVAGSTLDNPTSSITVMVDKAAADGVSKTGNDLTDGSATSTAVAIDAASLKSELDLLNSLLQNIPAGTVTALNNALAPIIANDPTHQVQGALNTVQNTLATPIADKLGNPSAHVLNSVSAKFGEDKIADIVTMNQGGLLSPAMAYHLDPFSAKALPAAASADNKVTSLDVAPNLLGQLQVPGVAPSLVNALSTLQGALTSAETKITGTSSQVPLVGDKVAGQLGTVFTTVNGATDTVVTVGTKTVDLDKINQLIDQLGALRNSLAALNGLTMNDILSNSDSTAFGQIHRDGAVVEATGLSQAGNIQAVKLNNPVIAGLLQKATGMDVSNTALVAIQGIKANALVKLDGHSKEIATADGHLAAISVLGKTVIDTDSALAPGTSCTISVPGKSTCGGSLSGLTIPDTSALGVSLATITLTRGIGQYPSTNSPTNAAAKIVTLDVAVDLNLSALSSVTSKLPALPLSLGAAANGTARIAEVQTGVATAEASLNPAITCQVACQPHQTPPSTGNNILPLAVLALALVAAGIGIGVRQVRVGRN